MQHLSPVTKESVLDKCLRYSVGIFFSFSGFGGLFGFITEKTAWNYPSLLLWAIVMTAGGLSALFPVKIGGKVKAFIKWIFSLFIKKIFFLLEWVCSRSPLAGIWTKYNLGVEHAASLFFFTISAFSLWLAKGEKPIKFHGIDISPVCYLTPIVFFIIGFSILFPKATEVIRKVLLKVLVSIRKEFLKAVLALCRALKTPSFKVGDTVQLKSGSPKMTITHVPKFYGFETKFRTSWFAENKLERGRFPAKALAQALDDDKEK